MQCNHVYFAQKFIWSTLFCLLILEFLPTYCFTCTNLYINSPITSNKLLYFFKVNDDGKPYQCKHAFNCPYQLEAFKKVLQKMAEKPEEYIGEKGKRTTNTAEGFHGNALAYCDKRIDLNCLHYECKTNMAILHKVKIVVSLVTPF